MNTRRKLHIDTKKINDHQIHKIDISLPPPNNDIFAERFPNVYLIACKNTGKTTTIHGLLNAMTKPGANIIIVFFASKIMKDPIYREIRSMLDKKGIIHIDETSLKDNNNLADIIEYLENEPDFEPELIFVIDDLQDEIKHSPDVQSLLKANRHIHATVIISTQSANDLPPNCIGQMDNVFAFSRIPRAKPINRLEKIWNDLGQLGLSYEDFEQLYEEATRPEEGQTKSHSFLFIDVNNHSFRRNLNEELIFDQN